MYGGLFYRDEIGKAIVRCSLFFFSGTDYAFDNMPDSSLKDIIAMVTLHGCGQWKSLWLAHVVLEAVAVAVCRAHFSVVRQRLGLEIILPVAQAKFPVSILGVALRVEKLPLVFLLFSVDANCYKLLSATTKWFLWFEETVKNLTSVHQLFPSHR